MRLEFISLRNLSIDRTNMGCGRKMPDAFDIQPGDRKARHSGRRS